MLDTLIIGYGNPSRQDDGVAWHILHQIAQEIGIDPELLNDGALDLGHASTHLLYRPQLTPELAEIIGNYSRVCFIDCHTGNIPQDTQFIPLNCEYQPSAFTHHMTPATCMALVKILYGTTPQAMLLSVRGCQFNFSSTLSEQCALNADKAVDILREWIAKPASETA